MTARHYGYNSAVGNGPVLIMKGIIYMPDNTDNTKAVGSDATEKELNNAPAAGTGEATPEYNDDNIRHLSDMEHVRTRPGMYIGRLGDGTLPEDGIYVLLKEVIDNSIDEFKMHAGDRIEVDVIDNLSVSVRDYGRGIAGQTRRGSVGVEHGRKVRFKGFQKSVGLNGVGVKAVNALSSRFEVKSYRDGKVRHLVFEKRRSEER